MRRILLAALCLGPLLLMGCPPTVHVEDPPSLVTVDFHHIKINQGMDYRLRITPNGELAFVLQLGPGDIRRASGRLTPDQVTELFNAFKGWGRLEPAYPGDWTNTILVTYNGYQVEVHDELQSPQQFRVIQSLLRTYLNAALQASTQAASQPATAPAAPR